MDNLCLFIGGSQTTTGVDVVDVVENLCSRVQVAFAQWPSGEQIMLISNRKTPIDEQWVLKELKRHGKNGINVKKCNDNDVWMVTPKIYSQWRSKTFQGHGNRVWSVAFSPDAKKIVSGSEDGTLKLWSVSGGECLKTLYGHSSHVTDVAFSPDGQTVVSGSIDTTLKLWGL